MNCLTPGDHQNARVYGADGGYPTMFSIHGETSGADGTAVCVRTANTGANGYGITEGAIAIDRRNQYGLYECQDSIKSTVSDGGSTVAIYFKGGQSADGGLGVDEGACQTMQSKMSALEPTVAVAIDQQGGKGMCGFSKEQMPTICSDSHGTPHAVAIGIGQQWRTTKGEDVMPTLDTRLAAQVDKQMERNGSYLCGPIQ